jgi:Leucine-rich repeat (LRR) protein
MELPNSIGKMMMLKELNLSNNKLSHVPESIGDLNCLETLNLKANYWINIPERLEKLKKQGLQIVL